MVLSFCFFSFSPAPRHCGQCSWYVQSESTPCAPRPGSMLSSWATDMMAALASEGLRGAGGDTGWAWPSPLGQPRRLWGQTGHQGHNAAGARTDMKANGLCIRAPFLPQPVCSLLFPGLRKQPSRSTASPGALEHLTRLSFHLPLLSPSKPSVRTQFPTGTPFMS